MGRQEDFTVTLEEVVTLIQENGIQFSFLWRRSTRSYLFWQSSLLQGDFRCKAITILNGPQLSWARDRTKSAVLIVAENSLDLSLFTSPWQWRLKSPITSRRNHDSDTKIIIFDASVYLRKTHFRWYRMDIELTIANEKTPVIAIDGWQNCVFVRCLCWAVDMFARIFNVHDVIFVWI